MDWKEAFSILWNQPIPEEFENMSLKKLLDCNSRTKELDNFISSCVVDEIGAYPVLVATPNDIAAAVGPAVAAVMNNYNYNFRMGNRNGHAFTGSASAPQPLFPLVKINAGAGPGLPNVPPAPPIGFVAIVAVGASPINFPATTQALDS